MTRIDSTQLYVPETGVEDLEVIPVYESLMQTSVGKDSIYIRSKDTMQAFFKASTMKDTEKATILSEMLTSMTTAITSQTLATALEIAKANRDSEYALTKLREDTLLVQEQRDLTAAENLHMGAKADLVEAQKNKMVIDGWKIQAGMVREDGLIEENIPSIDTVVLPATSLADRGLKWEQTQQTKMSVYATLAKSFRESGVVKWTVDSDYKINTITDNAPNNPGLTHAQTEVAVRQKIAFDDNKRQHAANSSANMIGLLLSAEEAGNITAADVTKWRDAVDYLNTDTIGD